MVNLQSFAILCVVASTLVAAGPISCSFSDHQVHESVAKLPIGWKHHSEPSHDTIIPLKIALKRRYEDILSVAEAISDPASTSYGQHLSAEELTPMMSVDDSKACATIQSWLRCHGIDSSTCEDGYVNFLSSIGNANNLLKSNFSHYQFENTDPIVRTAHYSLPSYLAPIVDFIYPTVHFLSYSRGTSNKLLPRQHGIPTGPSNCSNSICPRNLTARYNIDYYPPNANSGSKIGITGFIKNFPNRTSVESFLRNTASKSQKAIPSYSVSAINKGPTKAPTSAALQVEPILDLDYTLSFTGPLPATFYSTGGQPPALLQPGNKPLPPADNNNEPYLEFFEALLKEKCPPQVISISYSDDEQSVPRAYAQKVCNLMGAAAARGISIIGASGDGGAQGTGFSDCKGPDGKRRYIPTFPSSCPWITTVGATALYGGPASYSSGGFSNYFAVPSWQSASTKAYIKQLNTTEYKPAYYNASGRGIPDLSLLGDDYLVDVDGFNQTQKGTSASTPVFASMITMINDLRLRKGLKVLGHLGPLLYAQKTRAAFNDVVSEFGSSNGCADGDFFAPGWNAIKGWDASTGLGEPDFKKLRALLV